MNPNKDRTKSPPKNDVGTTKNIDKRIGNQFWKKRSKHGRDKIFSTPEILWEAACEYFDYVDSDPDYELKVFGTGVQVQVPKKKPYTIKGLCIFLDVNENYINQFEDENENNKDFSCIITRIRDVIYTQKFNGAANGFFDTNIIARDLGLKDNKDITSDGKEIKFNIGFKDEGKDN